MNTPEGQCSDGGDPLDGTRLLDRLAIQAAWQNDVLAPHAPALFDAIRARKGELRHGRLPQWRDAVERLPDLDVDACLLDQPCITVKARIGETRRADLGAALKALIPWRKGPFQIADQFIDCEWRSDWKWQRLAPHISCLSGRCVLDVGCGSGYHLWRMRGAGARCVLGIDPGLLFLIQFQTLQRYIDDPAVQYLPLTLESLPQPLACFDTTFSMGVLYHRRDPLQHLDQLRDTLRPGGELVLETLVIPGSADEELTIRGRYARMRNLWTLPTTRRLLRWVGACEFVDARLVHCAPTTVDEQRSTPWMPFESLAASLDSNDASLTVEGHPAPTRAIVVARRR